MTLQQLQYIVALDTHRHFVKAAESCFVAQPTLTLQVKKLEEEISLNIFDRSSQPLRPTHMGERFILKARQILREVDSLKEMVNSDRDKVEGTFRLGIIPTLAPYLLPLFLKQFLTDFPKVKLEIMEMHSEELLQAIHNIIIDVGLLVTPLYERHIREIPLFNEPFLVYANEGHSLLEKENVNATDLDNKGLWLLDKGHCFREQVLNICSKTIDLQASAQVTFQTGTIETLKNIVLSQEGYTLIPELSFNKPLDKNYVRRFTEPQPVREVSLAVHHSFTKETFLTELRRHIVKCIPNHFKKNERFIKVKWR